MLLSDDGLRWLAQRLRETGPAREAPTAHRLAGRLDAAIGRSIDLDVDERERVEVVVAVTRAWESGDEPPDDVRALRDAWA